MRGNSRQPSNRTPPQSWRPTRGWGLLAVGLALVVVMVACTRSPSPGDPGDEPGSVDVASQDEGPAAEIHRLSNRQWREMVEAGMVRPECPVQRPSELRVVQINHFDFDGAVKRGQLVVNADVAESVVRIFSELYEQRFPIRRMDPSKRLTVTRTPVSPQTTPPRSTAGGPIRSMPRSRRPHTPTEGPLTSTLARTRGVTCVAIAGSRARGSRRAMRGWKDHQGRDCVESISGRGMDLAEHRRPGLHALRHRVPVAPASPRPGALGVPRRRMRARASSGEATVSSMGDRSDSLEGGHRRGSLWSHRASVVLVLVIALATPTGHVAVI